MLVVKIEDGRKRSPRSLRNEEKAYLLSLLKGPIYKMGNIQFFDIDDDKAIEFSVYNLTIEQIQKICNELEKEKSLLNKKDIDFAKTIAECNLNLVEVSKKLGVSRTSVYKKINRIKQNNNIDLLNFKDLSNLLLN